MEGLYILTRLNKAIYNRNVKYILLEIKILAEM